MPFLFELPKWSFDLSLFQFFRQWFKNCGYCQVCRWSFYLQIVVRTQFCPLCLEILLNHQSSFLETLAKAQWFGLFESVNCFFLRVLQNFVSIPVIMNNDQLQSSIIETHNEFVIQFPVNSIPAGFANFQNFPLGFFLQYRLGIVHNKLENFGFSIENGQFISFGIHQDVGTWKAHSPIPSYKISSWCLNDKKFLILFFNKSKLSQIKNVCLTALFFWCQFKKLKVISESCFTFFSIKAMTFLFRVFWF